MLLAAIWICIASTFWFYGPDAALVCAVAAFLGAWKEANSRLDP
jgi:hypothetical protein